MEKEIQSLLSELFKLIGIEVKLEIKEEKEGEETTYKIELEPGESSGLLIGGHGQTLFALQSFVAIALKQKTGEWVKVVIDVSNWGQKQTERLTDLAQQTAERARQTGEEQRLYNLNPMQRREVHVALKEEGDIETLSEGEGQDRYLVVRLKK